MPAGSTDFPGQPRGRGDTITHIPADNVQIVRDALAFYVTGQGDNGKAHREALAALARLAQERDEWERRHAQRWEEVQQACERAEMAFRERDEARENNNWAGDVIKTADEARIAAEARAVAAEQALAQAVEDLRGPLADIIAIKPHLDQPYTDDPLWTPWTRFAERALARIAAVRDDLRAALSRPPTVQPTFVETDAALIQRRYVATAAALDAVTETVARYEAINAAREQPSQMAADVIADVRAAAGGAADKPTLTERES